LLWFVDLEVFSEEFGWREMLTRSIYGEIFAFRGRWDGRGWRTEIVLNQVNHVGVVGFCNLDGYGGEDEAMTVNEMILTY
jgi:hypothetical protein